MMASKPFLAVTLLCFTASAALAETVTVDINKLNTAPNQTKQSLGTVTLQDTKYGTLITPNLHHVGPGIHGFHVHQHPSCAPAMKDGQQVAGLAAGGHYDPKATNRHLGPYNDNGHLGDLPFLYADSNGNVVDPVLAPRITVKQIKNHAVILHEGGDNYSDEPLPLGGGGARYGCGVVSGQSR